jgi:surface antigen
MRKLITVIAFSAALGACAQGGGYGGGYGGGGYGDPGGRAGPGEFGLNKTTGGGLIGAGLGGLAGSQLGHGTGKLAMTGLGVLAGGLLGTSVGSSLDRADLAYSQRSMQQGLETAPVNRRTAWNNPDTGASGTVTPTRTFQSSGGQYCREFQQTITVGAQTEEGYGTACRQPDGSWKIVQ